MNVIPVGPETANLICPSCQANINTRVDYKANTRTHLIACVLFLFLCWPCICIPYCCTNSCKQADHYCPSCSAYIGTYSR